MEQEIHYILTKSCGNIQEETKYATFWRGCSGVAKTKEQTLGCVKGNYKTYMYSIDADIYIHML